MEKRMQAMFHSLMLRLGDYSVTGNQEPTSTWNIWPHGLWAGTNPCCEGDQARLEWLEITFQYERMTDIMSPNYSGICSRRGWVWDGLWGIDIITRTCCQTNPWTCFIICISTNLIWYNPNNKNKNANYFTSTFGDATPPNPYYWTWLCVHLNLSYICWKRI
jgi:hypothetical protein